MDNQIIIKDSIKTIDSREVAEMVEMPHADLLKKIRNYESILEKGKFLSHNFFIKSSYKVENNNRKYDCYLLTKKGCDMVANKLTGEKGIIFTARYVNRFEEMEKVIATPQIALPGNYLEALKALVGEVEMNQQLTLENNQLKFLLDGKDKEVKRLWTSEEIAKEHGMSAVKLNKILYENKIHYPKKKTWWLYRRHRNKGYQKRNHGFPKWTSKGKQMIEEILQLN